MKPEPGDADAAHVGRPPPKRRAPRRPTKGYVCVHIDIPAADAAIIGREASRLGLPKTHWIRALIAHRLRHEPCFTRDDELSLFALHAEARAMRTELAMMRRRLWDWDRADTPGLLELVERLDAALVRQRAAIRASLEGNLDYWNGEP